MKKGYVYILTNVNHTVLYTGVTSNLVKRVHEHKSKAVKGFTEKYNLHKLIYYEIFEEIVSAIDREKSIKGWMRYKKIDLIESINPEWEDLYQEVV